MKDTKVFLVERLNKDYDLSTALEYGDLAYFFDVTDRRSSIFQIDKFYEDLSKSFRQKNFRPDIDYFCILGRLITVSVALTALAVKYKTIKVLLYSAGEERYVSRIFSIDECLAE